MRLSEMNTEQTMDLLVNITPAIMEIVKDEELIKVFSERVKPKKGMSKEEINKLAMNKGFEKIGKLVPMLLGNHRNNIYTILAEINGKSIDEVKSQNPIKTIGQIQELLQDKELISFFSQLSK